MKRHTTGVTVVDESLTIVELSVTVVDEPLTIVELSITVVDEPLTIVEPALSGGSKSARVTAHLTRGDDAG